MHQRQSSSWYSHPHDSAPPHIFHFSAFRPCEVVELKRQNVDINPEYSDSLDSELFTVHLMFEKPTAETAQQADQRRFQRVSARCRAGSAAARAR